MKRGTWLDGVGHRVAEERRKPRGERLSTAGVEQHAACLASYSNSNGKPVWPSIAAQASWQGVHASTARRRQHRAVKLGVEQVERRQVRPGYHQSNLYQLEYTEGSSADLRARRLRLVAEAKAKRDKDRRELQRFTSRIEPGEPSEPEPATRPRCPGCGVAEGAGHTTDCDQRGPPAAEAPTT